MDNECRKFFEELGKFYGKAYNDGESFGYPGPGHWDNFERWEASAKGIHNAWIHRAEEDWPAYPETLEIGCGRGALVRELRKLDIPAIGIDIGDDTNGEHCTRGNCLELPYKDKFDLVVILDVIEHIPTDYQDLLHKELQRVTGKLLMATVPACEPFFYKGVEDGYLNHYIQTTPVGWAKLFVDQGWKVISHGAGVAQYGLPFSIGDTNYPFVLRP